MCGLTVAKGNHGSVGLFSRGLGTDMTIGTILRKAGFRWIFPIGTMPVPFHPAILLLFVFGPPLWIAWLGWSALANAEGGLRWWQPLVVAVALGVPMSIPFVAWGMMAFRAHFAQAMLFAGSMLLLAIDVGKEQMHVAWAGLPVGFVALYVIQRCGGMWQIARIRRAAEAWVAVDPGNRTLVLRNESHTAELARRLIAQCDIARIISVPSARGARAHGANQVMLHRLSADVARLIRSRHLAEPPGWRLSPDADQALLWRPNSIIRADAVTIDVTPFRSLLWIVTGPLQRFSVHGPDFVRQIVWGDASIVEPLPFFTCFHWTAVLGGKSEWHVGFRRQAPVRLGPRENYSGQLAALLVSRPRDGGRTDDDGIFASCEGEGGEAALSPIEQMAAAATADREAIGAFWRSIADEPRRRVDADVAKRLRDYPELIRSGDGDRLAAWLAACKQNRDKVNAHIAALLLERLPQAEFVAAGRAIFAVLNSRILAGEWLIGPAMDIKDVPRDCPRFGRYGGFGLMLYFAPLYDRLATLGAEEAKLVEQLRSSLGPAYAARETRRG